MHNQEVIDQLTNHLIHIISETNGVSLSNTLELLSFSPEIKDNIKEQKLINEFRTLLMGFQQDEVDIGTLLTHPVSHALFNFFKMFPAPFYEEHIHLTGSLTAEFIFPHLKKILNGPHKKIYEKKITDVYGKEFEELYVKYE